MSLTSDVRAAYGSAVDAWAGDASILYGPLADALVQSVPEPVDGSLVLDVGSGTGVASTRLRAAGARVVGVDISHAMLCHAHDTRPPGIVADTLALPLRGAAVDGVVAAFVLNHLVDPASGLAELRRVTVRGGWIVASAFSVRDRLPLKDEIDEVARRRGWSVPAWYRTLHDEAMPRVGTSEAMAATARRAGLDDVEVSERAIDVGRLTPAELVRYRFGMPQLAVFVRALDPHDRRRLFDEATERVASSRTDGAAVAPVVVRLVARVSR